MSANVESFGTERDDITGGKFPKYQGKPGNTDRVAIVYEDPKKLFKGAKTHFKERYFLCKSTKDKKEVCCTHSYKNNNPQYRIACVLVIYDLVTREGKQKLKDVEVLPWIFSETVYRKLCDRDKEFSLADYDIKLVCSTNKEYIQYDIVSCNSSIWKSNDELKARILKEAAPLFESMGKTLATDLSITEVKELLAIDSPGSEDAAADVDLGGVVESLE
jgi:hypothetical protein